MAEFRKYLSNDGTGATEHIMYFSHGVDGDKTSDDNANIVFVAPCAGKIVSVVGAVVENGSDATNPLTMAFVVKKNTTAVCSTDPAIAKTAASDATVNTYASGTGITQATIKTDTTPVCAGGDIITVDYDITRTASPTTEIAGPSVVIGFKPYAV
jgi:hypothetical protein